MVIGAGRSRNAVIIMTVIMVPLMEGLPAPGPELLWGWAWLRVHQKQKGE